MFWKKHWFGMRQAVFIPRINHLLAGDDPLIFAKPQFHHVWNGNNLTELNKDEKYLIEYFSHLENSWYVVDISITVVMVLSASETSIWRDACHASWHWVAPSPELTHSCCLNQGCCSSLFSSLPVLQTSVAKCFTAVSEAVLPWST